MNCGRKIGPFDCCSVVCGDCLELMKQLPDGCVDAVVTDPPYGVGIRYATPDYDDSRPDYWEWLQRRIDAFLAVCPKLAFTHRVTALKHISGYDWIAPWYKRGAFGSRLGNSWVLPHWEPIFLYGIHKTGVFGEYRSDVFEFDPEPARGIGRDKWRADSFTSHPCPKPRDLMEEIVSCMTDTNSAILDPFCGSGTTLVAAKKLGRHFLGFEISPEYCKIARDRLARVEAQPSLFQPKPEQLTLGGEGQ